jgi:hypothetical protein
VLLEKQIGVRRMAVADDVMKLIVKRVLKEQLIGALNMVVAVDAQIVLVGPIHGLARLNMTDTVLHVSNESFQQMNEAK